MSDFDTHELPLAHPAPAGSLTFDLPNLPPHESRIIATLRLVNGATLTIRDDEAPGSVAFTVEDGDGGVDFTLTDGEVERAIVAIRSAHWVKG